MKKILILFAHPAFQKSRVNKHLLKDVPQLENVTFHDLYEHYPVFDIDVSHEQQLLIQHDIVIFHHPFFWYSTPAILKEWQDLVLEHNWAYGSKGTALKGKYFFNVLTSGGGADAYTKEGYNGITIRQLLAPIEQTAKLCKMIFLPPYMVHSTHNITPELLSKHNKEYLWLLQHLRDESITLEDVSKLNYFNDYINHKYKE
ncbi:NAD(P)H-dependent oxidoreductase [Calditrichota bacterium]